MTEKNANTCTVCSGALDSIQQYFRATEENGGYRYQYKGWCGSCGLQMIKLITHKGDFGWKCNYRDANESHKKLSETAIKELTNFIESNKTKSFFPRVESEWNRFLSLKQESDDLVECSESFEITGYSCKTLKIYRDQYVIDDFLLLIKE